MFHCFFQTIEAADMAMVAINSAIGQRDVIEAAATLEMVHFFAVVPVTIACSLVRKSKSEGKVNLIECDEGDLEQSNLVTKLHER
jgi:hypothetical protein